MSEMVERVARALATSHYPDKDTDFMWRHMIPDALAAIEAMPLIEELHDKIEGLEADLDSAVSVAWERGATEWVKLNYPRQYERLAARKETP